MKRRGLGRGLDSLLQGGAGAEERSGETLRAVPLDLLERGRFQPRRLLDPAPLEALAASIRAQGVIQPIVVRALEGGRYELIAGERRWRAARLAGLHDIPALVRDLPDRSALAVALVENIQREELNAIEEAEALRRLIDEFELTQQQAADAVGRSRAAVANLLRLLALDDDVRLLVEEGALEMGHARALLALDKEQQRDAARTVIARGLTVRGAELLVRQMQTGGAAQKGADAKAEKSDPDTRRLEQELGERLGAKVALKPNRKGGGAVVIHYHSLEQLDGILERVR